MFGESVMSGIVYGRKVQLRSALFLLFLAGLLSVPVFAQQGVEQRKIEYLINSIADLHGAQLIRNGGQYDSKRAAAHLRVKLQHARGRVNTAEDFIVYCATGSSVTGDAYQIKFADGRIVATAKFLRERLAAYSAQEQNIPQSGDQ